MARSCRAPRGSRALSFPRRKVGTAAGRVAAACRLLVAVCAALSLLPGAAAVCRDRAQSPPTYAGSNFNGGSFARQPQCFPDPDQLGPVALSIRARASSGGLGAGEGGGTEAVEWRPPPWTEVGAQVRTPDLALVVQEAVRGAGWAYNSTLEVLVAPAPGEPVGGSFRSASGLERGAGFAPALQVTFTEGLSVEECEVWNQMHQDANHAVYSSLVDPFQRVTEGAAVTDWGDSYSAAWGDYDGDGDLDLFVANYGENNFLYENRGGGELVRVTEGAAVTDWGDSYSAAWGDYDGDGDLDLFVANYGENNFLYENRGGGELVRVTEGAAVTDWGDSYSAAWGDYDGDGDLDLFVANWDGDNNLYENRGGGELVRVTEGAAVTDGGDSRSAAWGDYDGDGDLDLFVANDFGGESNFLYENRGGGELVRVTEGAAVTDGGYSRSAAWGDYDGDGDLDLFVANWDGDNNLYENRGGGELVRVTEGAAVTDGGDSTSAAWGDYDGDGDLDLFVANGRGQKNFLYENRGNGELVRVTAAVTDMGISSFAAWGDYDGDGDLDLFVANYGANNFLYENRGDWELLRLIEGPLVTDGGPSTSAAWGDYDGDGDLDLFVANLGGENNFLYEYSGGGELVLVVNSTSMTHGRWFSSKVRVVFGGDGGPDSSGVSTGAALLRLPPLAAGGSAVVGEASREDARATWLNFVGVPIPPAACITSAWLELRVDESLERDLWQDEAEQEMWRGAVATPTTQRCLRRVTGGAAVTDGGDSRSAVWGDYDGDGDLDLFVANEGENNFLYENRGGGELVRVMVGAAVTDGGDSRSAVWGDYDGDGDLDLFVANYGENNFLYENRGGGELVRVMVGAAVTDGGYSISAAWGDYDGDGDLDLFVANWDGDNNFLYENRGGGELVRVTEGAAVTDGGNSRSAVWGDYDGDGDLDLFVANDGGENNFLYENRGGGELVRVMVGAAVSDGGDSTSAAWGDYDGDGDLDLFVANYGENNFLYENRGGGELVRVTEGAAVTDGGRSYSAAWGDYDGDGDLDLFVANVYGENHFLYENRGGGELVRVTEGAAVTDGGFWSNSAVWGDYDGDGDLDLFVANRRGVNNFLYVNRGGGKLVSGEDDVAVMDGGRSRSAAWGDYDGDGDLDLFVANSFGENNFLYENRGGGELVRVTEGAAVTDKGISSFAAWGDYDGDGDLDLFVANAGPNNFLYENRGGGELVRVTEGAAVTDGGRSYSAAWGDYDGDGDLDLFVANDGDENNFLYENRGGGELVRMTEGAAVTDGGYSHSAAWGDYDGDGVLDLFVANLGGENNFLYENRGGGELVRVMVGAAVTDGGDSNSAAWGDYDGDGDLDLFVANRGGENNFLYENRGGGELVRVMVGAAVTDGGDSTSAAWGDYDGDGDLDLFVANQGGENNFLYENRGGGELVRVTDGAAVTDGGDSNSAAWGDYDGDGVLDLFVANRGGENNFLYTSVESLVCPTGSGLLPTWQGVRARCFWCPTGHYGRSSANGTSAEHPGECRPCPAGKYNAVPGREYPQPKTLDDCQACPAADEGAEEDSKDKCPGGAELRCRAGAEPFQERGFSATISKSYLEDEIEYRFVTMGCRECPAGLLSGYGSDECRPCLPGAYAFDGDDECAACPRGGTCPGGAAGSKGLAGLQGFWRRGATDRLLYMCPATVEPYCLAEDPADAAWDESAPTPCRPGHGGPVCAVCEEGWAMEGIYCARCGGRGRSGEATAAVGACACVAVVLLLAVFWWRPFLRAEEERLRGAAEGLVARKKGYAALSRAAGSPWRRYLAIAVGFLQVVRSFSGSFSIAWPAGFVRMLSALSVVQLDILRLPSLACAWAGYSFYDGFLATSLGGLATAAILLMVFLLGSALHRRGRDPDPAVREGRRYDRDAFADFTARCWSNGILVLTVLYPPLSGAAISVFNCRDLYGVQYLVADYREECYGGRHTAYMAVAALFVAVYPVGIAVGFWASLRWFRVPQVAAAKERAAVLRFLLIHDVMNPEGDAPCRVIGAMCCGDLERAVERRASRMLEAGLEAVRAAYDGLHVAGRGNTDALGVVGGAFEGDVTSMAEEVAVGPGEAGAEVVEQEVKTAMEGGAGGLVNSLVSWAMASGGGVPRAMVSRWGAAGDVEVEDAVRRALLQGVLAPHAPASCPGGAGEEGGAAGMRHAASGFWEGVCSPPYAEVPVGQREEGTLTSDLKAYLCRLHGPGGALRPVGTLESPAEPPAADVLAAHCMTWAMESRAVAAAVPELGEKVAVTHVGFLFQDYEPRCWYFALADLVYKLLMTALLFLVSEGTSSRVLVGMLINLMYFTVHVRMVPYADATINRFQQATMVSTLLTLTAGLSIHTGVVAQETRDRRVFQAALIATTWLAMLVPALDKIVGALASAPRAWAAAAEAAGRLRERVR